MRQLISGHMSRWARRLLTLAIFLYFALGLGLLALRYAVLPQVDHWRPQIAQRLSDSLGVTVALGPLSVDWRGWNPDIRVHGVSLDNAAGRKILQIQDVRARLDWRALLPGEQGFLRLNVTGMALDVERLADGSVNLPGLTLAPDDEPEPPVPAWLQWTLAQPSITFQNVTVRWLDHQNTAPALEFDQIQAIWKNPDGGSASLQVSARAPQAGESRVQLRAAVADTTPLLQGKWPTHARAWLAISQFHPLDWRAWIPQIPATWQRGTLDFQAWVGIQGADRQVTVLGRLASLDWEAPGDTTLQVPSAQVWAQGPVSQWRALAAGQPMPIGLAFDLRAAGVRLARPQWFASALDLGAISARGRLLDPGAWQVHLDAARWNNADADLQGSGDWRAAGAAGVADLQGTIARANLAAIHRYLPLAVNADARDWLADGLQAGDLSNAHWRLQGDLAEFPFGEQPHAGDFQITGDFHNARMNLVPDKAEKDSWPLLYVASGNADLHRTDLRLWASQASMSPTDGNTIAMTRVQARIPDLENTPVLMVSGLTAAPAAAYVALIQHSPLDAMLNGLFAKARGTGDWQVPLALTVPLQHSEDTQVRGRVDLAQASLQFLPGMPAFQSLDGSIYFDENGIQIAQPLKGRVLGGAVQAQGSLGGTAAPGLSFRGKMTARAVGQLVNVPGMKRVTGDIAYQAHLVRQKRGHTFTLESDTGGLALDFPAPLSKPASELRTLTLQWSDADPQADTLEVRYGANMRVDLRHTHGPAGDAYFQQAAIGIGQAAALAPGLQIEIAYPLFDLDRWNRILDEFSIVRRGQTATGHSAQHVLWPNLTLLSVQADQLRLLGTRLDHAVVRAVKTPGEHWSMNIRSTQTTGTLKWQEQNGRVTGRMAGRFARLSLGDDARDNNALLPDAKVDEGASFDDDLEIPGIVLQADELRLYGRSVGALSLEGERDGAQHLWQLTRLRITGEKTTLRGTGVWRLRGPDRGLSLDASVETTDLGAWMDHAGWSGVMVGGVGSLKGHFEWRDLPWTHDKANLQGDLQIALNSGRFLKLGSHTAKLLEFLSLQSIARLTKLDRGLAGLLKEGVPFDQLRGAISLNHGEAQVHDYKFIGSIGTILLEGSANIVDETLNLQAVVVPNLDVSGAAIAAGIAINPIVGIGAFITQWLLKMPLAKAMTAHYRITGSWDEPKVVEVPLPATPSTQSASSIH